jgi:hypothetical protein
MTECATLGSGYTISSPTTVGRLSAHQTSTPRGIDVNKVEGTQLARLPNELLCRINDIVMQSTYTRCYTLPDGTIGPTSSCRLAPA